MDKKLRNELEKKKASADRTIFWAERRYAYYSLYLRLGEKPTEYRVIGTVNKIPYVLTEIRQQVRKNNQFRRLNTPKSNSTIETGTK